MPDAVLSRDVQDTLAAIERLLHRHKLLSPEQAFQAARLVTGDPAFEFPPPTKLAVGPDTARPPPAGRLPATEPEAPQ